MKKIILVPGFMLIVASAHAQLGVAPLPQLQRNSGPSLEETQAWVKNRFEAIGVVENRKETALFDGCKYYVFDAYLSSDDLVQRNVQHGNLEDIDFDGDPDRYPTTVGGIKLLFRSFNFNEDYNLRGEKARRYWRFDPAILQELKKGADIKDPDYTTKSDTIIFFIAGRDDILRFTKAFMHMAKLCAAEKVKSKPKNVKPANEPF